MEHNVNYMRQTLLFDPSGFPDAAVTIVGLGNIGSHTALTLSRLGILKFQLFDHDTVENHNLSSQAYSVDELGEEKVTVISRKIVGQNLNSIAAAFPIEFTGLASEISPLTTLHPILIIAIDTMDGRKAICENLITTGYNGLIIDGRVGGSQLEVYVCNGPEEWKKTFVDNPGSDPCGGRFICYTSVMIASIITNIVKKHLKGERVNQSIMVNVDTMEVVKDFAW